MISRRRDVRPENLPADIHADLVETLFATVGSFIAGVLGGVLVPVIGWLRTGNPAFIYCGAILIALSIFRIAALVRHNRSPVATRRARAEFWEGVYAFGGVTFMTGVGATSAYLLSLRQDEITDIYAVSIAISCAGALAGRNAGRPAVVMGQVAGVCAPVGLVVLLDYHWGLAAMLVLLIASVSSTTKFLNGMLVSALLAGREARIQRERFSTALNTMSHGLCMAGPQGSVSVLNERLREFFDLHSELEGLDIAGLGRAIASSAAMAPDEEACFQRQLEQLVSSLQSTSFVSRIGIRQYLFRCEPNPEGGVVIVVDDVTEARRAAAEVERLAHFDSLTSLPNRLQLHSALEEQLLAGATNGARLALLSVDLDRFKEVNDTLGHPTGDKLLTLVAGRLRDLAPPPAVVARFGGDEFQICLPETSGDEDLDAIAKAIVDTLSAPYSIGEHAIIIGASVGIAIAPRDARDADGLLKCADMALYAAKAAGRGTFAYFSPEMDAAAQRRRQIELELRIAVATGQLEVHYQPIVDAPTGRLVACEALVRWRHPVRGMVPPDQFIPAAEETGIIVDVGRYVLRRACLDALSWPAHVRLAVNVSPKQFSLRQDFVQATAALIRELAFPADRLELEITEGSLMEHKDPLKELRAMGIRIALDDFGTGYSSLSYLQKFKVDKIKIDSSFTRNLDSKASLAVVDAIASLARALQIEVVVEGVETPGQLLLLTTRNVRLIQGYLFSPPVAHDVLVPMFDRRFEPEPALQLRSVASR